VTLASVVIPAHNEQQGIARLLGGLVSPDRPGEFEVVVVCNGCTDATAEIASGFGPDVRVIELAQPSKREAQRVGNETATAYPRLFVDADVVLSAASARHLADAVSTGTVLAAAPARTIPRDGVGLLVRCYYDVWERLPQVRTALYGRGVIALSAVGNERVRALPAVMADDLVMSEAFADHEKLVVADAQVVVLPPKRVRDLYRRRVRAATGNAQADHAGLRREQSSTSWRTLVRIIRAEPSMLLRMPVFVGVSVVGTLGARRAIRAGDFDTWRRDESSRS
jgi:glycosyltransferase involved in cell wall biosynthesis